MPPTDDDRLRHMLDAVETILSYREGLGRDLSAKSAARDGIAIRLCVLGEAANRLSQEAAMAVGPVTVRGMAGVRGRFIHDYHRIDFKVVAATIDRDLGKRRNRSNRHYAPDSGIT